MPLEMVEGTLSPIQSMVEFAGNSSVSLKRTGAMKKKKDEIPILKVRKGATLREIYARIREEFTAADLQKFTEIDEGIPAEQVLARMEKVHQRYSPKKKRSAKRPVRPSRDSQCQVQEIYDQEGRHKEDKKETQRSHNVGAPPLR